MFFMNGGHSRSHDGPVDTALYDILKVKPNASDDEIKKSYRQLAKEFHPDKNPSHGDKFKEISFAYEILSNPDRRHLYDVRGLDGIKEGGGGGGFSGAEDLFSSLFEGSGGSPFSSFFGGMGGGSSRRRMRGQDIAHPLKVTLEELFSGKTSKLQLSKRVICGTCNGMGSKDGSSHECSACRGRGIRNVVRQIGPGMIQQCQMQCSDCNGDGSKIPDKDRCKACKGEKTIAQAKTLEVRVERGMRDNQKIVFKGEADQQPGVEPGDVIIVLQMKEHEVFKRQGDNLFIEKKISLNEALCGVQMVVKHLDGRNIVISTAAGDIMEPESLRGVRGEGMPMTRNPELRGILFVKFDVEFPEDHFFADEKQYKVLESLLGGRPHSASSSSKSDVVEEVSLMPYDERRFQKSNRGNREAYHDDEEDEDEDDDMRGGGARNVQCAQS